jgi:hypothetical protein
VYTLFGPPPHSSCLPPFSCCCCWWWWWWYWHIFFTHSSVEEHLCWFHCLTIVTTAAVNMGLQGQGTIIKDIFPSSFRIELQERGAVAWSSSFLVLLKHYIIYGTFAQRDNFF